MAAADHSVKNQVLTMESQTEVPVVELPRLDCHVAELTR
jgi:hypothetical protein